MFDVSRQFWLFLALLTENYQPSQRAVYIDELKQYTSSNYGHSIREIAFEYTGYMSLWDTKTLTNLVDAGQHHYWRFKNSSRAILKGLLEDEVYREQLIMLGKDLDAISSKILNRMLNE